MVRPLRMEVTGGRFHATARGNERKTIFRDERDRLHFLSLLGQWPGRFGVRIQAYVLMDNHYHLVLETPEGNLSRAMQWLNVSYSVWFNVRHRRHGHLLQGRFKAVLIEDLHGSFYERVVRNATSPEAKRTGAFQPPSVESMPTPTSRAFMCSE